MGPVSKEHESVRKESEVNNRLVRISKKETRELSDIKGFNDGQLLKKILQTTLEEKLHNAEMARPQKVVNFVQPQELKVSFRPTLTNYYQA